MGPKGRAGRRPGALEAVLAQDDGLAAQGDATRLVALTDDQVTALMNRAAPRTDLTLSDTLPLHVDRQAAAFSAWYELMPRSQSGSMDRARHLRDVIARLPYVRDLGFDVLYFPPIHPIGAYEPQGSEQQPDRRAGRSRQPYAIGSADGGHDAIHPELGDFDDFRRLIDAARDHGLEIALDFAIQCSPITRGSGNTGMVRLAPRRHHQVRREPAKKYEDIVNVHFLSRCPAGAVVRAARHRAVLGEPRGAHLSRGQPAHQAFPFWEWMIAEVRRVDPGVIFLAEAFTRPKVMKRLAKVGFSQSYSYFTWRNEKAEITEYLTELTQTDSRLVMNPNFFVNTPTSIHAICSPAVGPAFASVGTGRDPGWQLRRL